MTRDEAIKAFNTKRLAAMDRVRRDQRLTSSIRTIGAELFSKAYFNTGFADVDQDHLVEKLGLSARTVKTAIKVLQETGYFEVVRPGRRSSNRYRPIFEAPEVQNLHLPDDVTGAKFAPAEAPEVQKTTAGGAKNDRREVQNLHHSTSLSNSLEASLPLEGAASGDEGAGGRPSGFEEIAGRALRQKLGENLHEAWFSKLGFVSEGLGTLTLIAPTKFIATYVKTHFEQDILACLGRSDIDRLVIGVGRVSEAVPSLGDHRTLEKKPPPNPDAQWLVAVGIDLVSDLAGIASDKAAEVLKGWLAACARDPGALRQIVTAVAEQGLQGEAFKNLVRQRAASFRQGQLKFGVEERLKKRNAS